MKLFEEINWELERQVIKQECDAQPYGNWEAIERRAQEDFAKWLVEKFVEETSRGDNDSEGEI